MIMEQVINFLRELRRNNNREWFEAHKGHYKQVQAEVERFTEELIEGISSFDDSVRGLSVKDCTYRIYRDTRFGLDKTPYKTHIGIFVSPGGKKSGNSGYYVHLEPPTEKGEVPPVNSLGGFLLTSGIYMPEPSVLHSIREDICYNGEEFAKAIDKAPGFSLSQDNKLKRLPVGFPADCQYAEYLKLKDVYLEMHVPESFIIKPGLVKRCVDAFAKTYDFSRRLNMAAEYARENK